MTGIYGGDGDLLSLRATFPQLRVLELEHGSVLRGLPRAASERSASIRIASQRDGLARCRSRRRVRAHRAPPWPSCGPRVPTRCRLRDRARRRRVARSGRCRGRHARVRLRRAPRGSRRRPRELPMRRSRTRRPSSSRSHSPRADLVPLDGYGYVVPRVEGTDVLACTWTSQKWEDRAPDGSVLIRVYAGRFGGRDLTEDSDDDLVALARERTETHRCHRRAHAQPVFTAGPAECRSTSWGIRTVSRGSMPR